MEQKLSRTERKKEETKQRIYQTALELFLAKGYEQTSVEEIVEKADVAKGTFFYHFPKKAAILAHLGEKRLERIRNSVIEGVSERGTVQDKVTAILRELGQLNETEPDETKLVVMEALRRFDEIDELNKKATDELGEKLGEILHVGQVQGEIAADIDLEHAVRMIVGLYFITLLEWINRNQCFSLSEDLVVKTEMLFNGLKVGRS
ncbi:MAG: TetR/AcrR family transcriptional regulator [Clostridia bacterium]|nr:TetR/AcrR family transcriptional regulator [Clostridia bacterium]